MTWPLPHPPPGYFQTTPKFIRTSDCLELQFKNTKKNWPTTEGCWKVASCSSREQLRVVYLLAKSHDFVAREGEFDRYRTVLSRTCRGFSNPPRADSVTTSEGIKAEGSAESKGFTKISLRPEIWYQCDYCEYNRRAITAMKRHVRIHTKEKPYKCDECDYASAQSSNTKEHKRRVHSGNIQRVGTGNAAPY